MAGLGVYAMKILILDDDPNVLEALRLSLSQYEHDVVCVNNAEDAVSLVAKETYDFILVDYRMPEKDGVWFMQNVKMPPETKALLMTAYLNRDVINKMFAIGVSGYLLKPFDEEELLRHLDFHSRGRASE